MVERPSRPILSRILRGFGGAVIILALGPIAFSALGRWSPFAPAPCPAADCEQPPSAQPSTALPVSAPSEDASSSALISPDATAPAPLAGANPAALRAAAPLTSWLPAYFPRVEVAPQPALELRSQLGGSSRGIALRGQTVFVGLGARVLAFDVSDPDAPVEMGRSPLLPGVVEDIQLAGDLAWVAIGAAGILALDIMRPEDITVVGAFDTPGHSLSLDVSTDVGLLADEGDLLALDLRDPEAIREIGRWTTPGLAVHVTRRGDTAFVSDERSGLHVLDVGNPAAMQQSEVFDRYGDARAALVFGSTLYFHSGRDIHVLDARDPEHLKEAGHLSLGRDRGSVRAGMAIAQSGLVADGRLYDLSDPWFPRRISGPLDDTKGTDLVRGDAVATDGDLVVAARSRDHGGFILGDISDPRAPRRRGGLRTLGELAGETLSRLPNEAALDLGGQRIDVRDADHPRLEGERVYDRVMRLNDEWGLRNTPFDSSKPWPSLELNSLQPPLRTVSVPTPSDDEDSRMWYAELAVLLGDTAWIVGSTIGGDPSVFYSCPVVAALDLTDFERPRWAGQLDSAEDLPAEIGWIAADAASSTVVIGHDFLRCDGLAWDGPGELTILDATDPDSPVVIDHLSVPAYIHDIVTWQGTAYVAADSAGLRVIDLAGPDAPREVAYLDDGFERAWDLELDWPYLWLSDSHRLRLIDIREPARPRELERRDLPSAIVAMTLHRGMLWVATAEAGLLGYRVGR